MAVHCCNTPSPSCSGHSTFCLCKQRDTQKQLVWKNLLELCVVVNVLIVLVVALLSDSSLVVSIVGEVEEAESFVLSQSLAVEEESDGEQETAAEGEESERVRTGAIEEIKEYAMKYLVCVCLLL